MDNSFTVQGSSAEIKDFIETSIKTATEIISHYDFVLNDLSSNISNEKLQATKGPTIAFLKDMKNEWVSFKDGLERKLQEIEKEK